MELSCLWRKLLQAIYFILTAAVQAGCPAQDITTSAQLSPIYHQAEYNYGMTSDLMLRRKWTLRAYDKQVVFIKKANEHASHVLMKAFLWALYLPAYPNLSVEVPVGDRYKPDVVAVDELGQPRFWGEAGQVSPDKIRSLARRYRQTHFAIAKWNTGLEPLMAIVEEALAGLRRSAPFDLLCFPPDSADRFIDRQGQIQLSHADLEWLRLE